MTPAVKIILAESIKAGFFDDMIRDACPTDPEDKAALLAYLQSEKYVRTVNTDPTGTNMEVTA